MDSLNNTRSGFASNTVGLHQRGHSVDPIPNRNVQFKDDLISVEQYNALALIAPQMPAA